LNGTPVENLSLVEARKQIDKSKDKLQLSLARGGFPAKPYSSPLSLQQLDQPGKLPDTASYLLF